MPVDKENGKCGLAEMIKMFSHLVIIWIHVTGKKSHVYKSSKNECNWLQ